MGRRSISFTSYDPYNDSRIDPRDSRDLYRFPELPDTIHDTVRRAKILVGVTTLDELKDRAEKIETYCKYGKMESAKSLFASNYNYMRAGESRDLMNYLKFCDHEIPVDEHPRLLGILAMSLAGEIVNALWPSGEYLGLEKVAREIAWVKSINPDYDPINSPKGYVMDLANEALIAVGHGEVLSVSAGIVKREMKTKNDKKNAADKGHEEGNKIKDRCLTWYEENKNSGLFKSPRAAAKMFYEKKMDDRDKSYITDWDTLYRHLLVCNNKPQNK